jgi:hypothetical protein
MSPIARASHVAGVSLSKILGRPRRLAMARRYPFSSYLRSKLAELCKPRAGSIKFLFTCAYPIDASYRAMQNFVGADIDDAPRSVVRATVSERAARCGWAAKWWLRPTVVLWAEARQYRTTIQLLRRAPADHPQPQCCRKAITAAYRCGLCSGPNLWLEENGSSTLPVRPRSRAHDMGRGGHWWSRSLDQAVDLTHRCARVRR